MAVVAAVRNAGADLVQLRPAQCSRLPGPGRPGAAPPGPASRPAVCATRAAWAASTAKRAPPGRQRPGLRRSIAGCSRASRSYSAPWRSAPWATCRRSMPSASITARSTHAQAAADDGAAVVLQGVEPDALDMAGAQQFVQQLIERRARDQARGLAHGGQDLAHRAHGARGAIGLVPACTRELRQHLGKDRLGGDFGRRKAAASGRRRQNSCADQDTLPTRYEATACAVNCWPRMSSVERPPMSTTRRRSSLAGSRCATPW